MQDDSIFCHKCGTKIPSGISQSNPPSQSGNRQAQKELGNKKPLQKQWWFWVVITILVTTVLALTIFAFVLIIDFLSSSKGLEYELSEDGKYYIVVGAGSHVEDEKIVIPSRYKTKPVKSIDPHAFYKLSNLKNIKIPNSVTTIGNSAFAYCNNLTSLEIPKSVTTIGDDAFVRCCDLTSLVIPDSVTSIGAGAFSSCFGLTTVTLSSNLTSIGDYVFAGCNRLTTITIPKSITTIGNRAFYNCNKLMSITFEGTVRRWKTIMLDSGWNSNSPITEVVCSDGVVKLN